MDAGGSTDDNGRTALMRVCMSEGCTEERLRAALSGGANVDQTDGHGKSALHHVIEGNGTSSKGVSLCRLLVDSRASVNAADAFGRAALHKAVASGNVGVVEYLLESKAAVNAKDNSANTPLHVAASLESSSAALPICKALLLHGADPGATNVDGYTPVIKACDDAVAALIGSASVVPNSSSSEGATVQNQPVVVQGGVKSTAKKPKKIVLKTQIKQ